MEAGGWFARGFTTTAGIMVAVLACLFVFVVLPMILLCGGCGLVFTSLEQAAEKARIEQRQGK
jgi:hypothetical protein